MGDLFASIKRGLEESIAHQKGEKAGMTQEQFAATFGISLGTLRHWERGDRRPHGPALVFLNAVAKEPGTVLRILTGKRVVKGAQIGKEKAVRVGRGESGENWSVPVFLGARIMSMCRRDT